MSHAKQLALKDACEQVEKARVYVQIDRAAGKSSFFFI